MFQPFFMWRVRRCQTRRSQLRWFRLKWNTHICGSITRSGRPGLVDLPHPLSGGHLDTIYLSSPAAADSVTLDRCDAREHAEKVLGWHRPPRVRGNKQQPALFPPSRTKAAPAAGGNPTAAAGVADKHRLSSQITFWINLCLYCRAAWPLIF